ncbi:MAG: formate dehydrogenase accessory sulfurtransferase FdhD [Vicinamibacterales bacterium]
MTASGIRIGISACLLGQQVRYDGGHKRADYLRDLGADIEWVPVCPEVEMGLGTPREPMNLVKRDGSLRMIAAETGIDHTETLQQWAARRLEALASEDLSGYVLKADSPSCGMEQVTTFDDEGQSSRDGRGLFAAAVMARFPQLPVEDERRLADPAVREDFLRRVTAYHAARQQQTGGTLDPMRTVSVVRVSGGRTSTDSDVAAVEEPLEIRLHDRPFVVIMRTPGADRELAAGFLFAEGVIRHAGELGAVEHCRHPHHPDVHNVVNVFLMGEAGARVETTMAERRNVMANSSCGICGRVTIDSLKTRAAPLATTAFIDAEVLHGLPDALRSEQSVFEQTGGLHGAALFTTIGALVASSEDVGRHNAVDKVIGRLLLDEKLPLSDHVLVVSGRTSFEIVQKAWLAGVQIICAVSAPSSLAIELAAEAGITLLGFARDRAFNIYSHPQRIRGV